MLIALVCSSVSGFSNTFQNRFAATLVGRLVPSLPPVRDCFSEPLNCWRFYGRAVAGGSCVPAADFALSQWLKTFPPGLRGGIIAIVLESISSELLAVVR